MRVALIVHHLHGNDGWSRYALDVAEALRDRGHDVHVLVATTAPAIPGCTQHPCLHAPLRSLHPVGALLETIGIRRMLRTLRPEVVHVIAEPYALPCSLVTGPWKWILTVHGSYAVIPFRRGWIPRRLFERFLRRAHCVIAVSAFTAGKLQEQAAPLGIDSRIRVIHNAVRMDGIQQAAGSGDSTTPRIIGVGAVKNRKGFLQAVRALCAYRRRTGKSFRYDIVGTTKDASYTDTVRREIDALQLSDCIRIHGAISESDLRALYEKADLFLLLSLAEGEYFEGFVLGFLEAAARGIPCIGPTTGGCPEAIKEGQSGYVVDPYDADATATAISNILDRHAIDRSSCRSWASAHDVRNVVRDIEAAYSIT